MLLETPLFGYSLPEKTLCLTFDDGPGETADDQCGPKTEKIAAYLYEQHISATFFVVGKFAKQYPKILERIVELGHSLGNHTYHHPHLINMYTAGREQEIIDEITNTSALLTPYLKNKNIYFRAPYGSWNSNIAKLMHLHLQDKLRYIGPFHWDISGDDWYFWEKGASAEKCAETYLELIQEKGKGILLLHDSTADPIEFNPNAERMKANNRVLETIKILIPQLKKEGYSFARLDEIPHIADLF